MKIDLVKLQVITAGITLRGVVVEIRRPKKKTDTPTNKTKKGGK
jgi:hypothetical protein